MGILASRGVGLGKKAISGKVLTIVITLVVAIVALILLWAGLADIMPLITKTVEEAITGFKRMICGNTPVLKDICRLFLGA